MRCALIAAILLSSTLAYADEQPKPKKKLHWDEERPRFRLPEYIATGVLGPLAVAEYFVVPESSAPRWIGGILFDDAVRDGLRLRDPTALKASWAFADLIGTMLVVMSVGVDSLIVPLARRAPDVAWQLL